MTRSYTRFVGILGWPLDHTLSPAIHNVALRALKFDWVYLRFAVSPDDLGRAVAGLRALGGMGANVTIPHKETIVDLLDDLSGDARDVGAVNTVQRMGDKLIGHNTDVDGFRDFLRDDAGCDVAGRTAVVLGAGGAARAVVRGLHQLEAANITVVSRDDAKSAAVASLAGASVGSWGNRDRLAGAADIVVNATSLGMEGESVLPETMWSPAQVAVDLVYFPPVTPLLEAARASGATAWGGLGMLVRQAGLALRIWTGQDAPLETMSAAAIRALSRWG